MTTTQAIKPVELITFSTNESMYEFEESETDYDTIFISNPSIDLRIEFDNCSSEEPTLKELIALKLVREAYDEKASGDPEWKEGHLINGLRRLDTVETLSERAKLIFDFVRDELENVFVYSTKRPTPRD